MDGTGLDLGYPAPPSNDRRALDPDWAAVVEHLPDAVTVTVAVRGPDGTPVDMRLEYMNAAARAGQPDPASAIGSLCSELWPQMVANGSFAACLRVLATGEPAQGAFQWSGPDTDRPGEYGYRAVRVGHDRLVWVLRDVDDTTLRLDRQRARFRSAFDASAEGMALVTPFMEVVEVNPSLCRIAGRNKSTLVGADLRTVLHRATVDKLVRASRAAPGAVTDPTLAETRTLGPDGRMTWLRIDLAPVHEHPDEPSHYIVHVLDVSEAKRNHMALAHAVRHDALTSLANRTLIVHHIASSMRRQRHNLCATAVLFIDLDHFKVVNDSLGHDKGDHLLRIIATRLDEATGPGDVIGRLGGDEFVVVRAVGPHPAGADDLDAFAQRILATIAEPVLLDGRRVVVTATIGVALADDTDATPDDLLRDADIAMYDAKRAGGARVRRFGPAMRARVLNRLELEVAIRAALAAGDFLPWFQPVVDLVTDRVVGAEALARWRRGDEIVTPAGFLEVAEQSGLIEPLSTHVGLQALAALAAWRRDGEDDTRWMSVNVTARQLDHAGFVDDFLAALRGHGLPPSSVVVELTEGTLLAVSSDAHRALARLRDVGARVAIDDFGTGYSSLAYLRDLPVDILKLDRSFVSRAPDDPRDLALVRTFVDMSLAIGLEVIAEGIETDAQREAVVGVGCRLGQGYLMARPAPALPS